MKRSEFLRTAAGLSSAMLSGSLLPSGSGVAAAAAEPGTPVPKAWDWKLETAAAAWRPRDSSGEVVLQDRMWILGGWFDSFSPPPRDVWSSADGVTWEEVQHSCMWISHSAMLIVQLLSPSCARRKASAAASLAAHAPRRNTSAAHRRCTNA